jgi:oligopeptide/dipeptide ABC transporter ATP-binding protein
MSVSPLPTAPASPQPVLEIRNLVTEFAMRRGPFRAVDDVTLDLFAGKTTCVVGESGSGKSVMARSILQIVDPPGRVLSGQILLHRHRTVRGRKATGEEEHTIDLAGLHPRSGAIRAIRGRDVAMIFQEPMSSLSPVHRIGDQIGEVIRLHEGVSRKEARDRSIELLRRVEIPRPEVAIDRYPFEYSGGMRQRAMIAMALSCHPALLIADEPTTALDVTTEAQILSLMRRLKTEIGMSIMFITHSMGVVAQLCDEVIVMYQGRVVERASVDDIFYAPKHPYTRSLLRSIPRIGAAEHTPLEVIKGSVPDPYATVPGCSFHPRCPDFIGDVCQTVIPPETLLTGGTHGVRCHLYDDERALAGSTREA